MATIRKWLDRLKFDWDSGTIIHATPMVEWWNKLTLKRLVPKDDLILDYEFDNGYGDDKTCPSIIAEDHEYIYLIQKYDGATSMLKVYKDVKKYLGNTEPLPRPGGG